MLLVGFVVVLSERIVHQCQRATLTQEARQLRSANRTVVIMVQTLTASKSNVCLGLRSDWREGLGQCLARLTKLRVVAHNDDGTCADCATLKPVPCSGDRPPGLVIVLGGGEDPNRFMRIQCSGTYCRRTNDPITVSQGHFPPQDFLGACDVHAFDKRGAPLFASIATKAVPPTRVAWFPILSPHAEIRALWERSTLYATDVVDRAIPELTRKRVRRKYPEPSEPKDSDYAFLKRVVEPAFEAKRRRVRIDVVRDDAFAKPLLLPPLERQLYTANARDTPKFGPRAPVLLYAGRFGSGKGQLSFLRKLELASLGPFTLEFFFSHRNDTQDWDAFQFEVQRLRGRVLVHDAKISHLLMMRKMATATGYLFGPVVPSSRCPQARALRVRRPQSARVVRGALLWPAALRLDSVHALRRIVRDTNVLGVTIGMQAMLQFRAPLRRRGKRHRLELALSRVDQIPLA